MFLVRFFLLFVGVLAPLYVTANTNNSYGVDVQLKSSDSQTVVQGHAARFDIVVTNLNPKGQNYVGRIIANKASPIPVPDELFFYLSISASSHQEVSLYVPDNTPPGTYKFVYFVEGRDNSVYRNEIPFSVRVVPFVK